MVNRNYAGLCSTWPLWDAKQTQLIKSAVFHMRAYWCDDLSKHLPLFVTSLVAVSWASEGKVRSEEAFLSRSSWKPSTERQRRERSRRDRMCVLVITEISISWIWRQVFLPSGKTVAFLCSRCAHLQNSTRISFFHFINIYIHEYLSARKINTNNNVFLEKKTK